MKKVAIIGGGASGLFLACILSKYDFEITIFEKEERVGRKLLRTGNGRCNILNMNVDSCKYGNKFVEKLLETFPPLHIFQKLEAMGLKLRTEEDRVYPYSNTSQTVLNVFLKHLKNVAIKTCEEVLCVKKEGNMFLLETAKNKYASDILIMAPGSPAGLREKYNGYDIARCLNHRVMPLYPSLCPLKVKEDLKAMAGIRIKCNVKMYLQKKEVYFSSGEVLFKKDALSGIVIFDAAKYYRKGEDCYVSLDLFPTKSIDELNRELYANNDLENNIIGFFPKMINREIIKRSGCIPAGNIIKDFRFSVTGTYDLKDAQTVRGGVATDEIDPATYMSKSVDDLYFTGEILDVDGRCGGYNLYFALASAAAVVESLLKKEGICDEKNESCQ